MMCGPALASRRWIWEQYDHMVMGDTVQRPGGDAAVVRIHGTQKGLALTCDVTPRYVTADPVMGTKQAVVETWRNLTAVGADPLAITDNMNFANPERPEVMGQFVGSVKGMTEACRVLDYPVVSGNVSLYNETNGVGIPPTPAIGGVGLIPDVSRMADIKLKRESDLLIVIGREAGHLGQSLYQELATGKLEGAPPPVDLADEIKAGRLVRALIREGKVNDRARRVGRRPARRHRRDGAGRRHGRRAVRLRRAPAAACDVVRRGPGPLRAGRRSDAGRGSAGARAPAGAALAHRRPHRRRARSASRASPPLPLAELRAAHEAWLPGYMAAAH